MGVTGIEPASRGTQANSSKQLAETTNLLAAEGQRLDCTLCHQLSLMEDSSVNQIQQIVVAWPQLNENIRTAILYLSSMQEVSQTKMPLES